MIEMRVEPNHHLSLPVRNVRELMPAARAVLARWNADDVARDPTFLKAAC